MQRAIITAPVARNLNIDFPILNLYKIPRATNGTLQAWSTNEGDDARLTSDAALTIYTTWSSIPLALRKFLLVIRTRDNTFLASSEQWILWQDCDATRFTRVWSTLTGTKGVPGPLTTKAVTTILATDRFTDDFSNPAHSWFGVDDTSMGGNG